MVSVVSAKLLRSGGQRKWEEVAKASVSPCLLDMLRRLSLLHLLTMMASISVSSNNIVGVFQNLSGN